MTDYKPLNKDLLAVIAEAVETYPTLPLKIILRMLGLNIGMFETGNEKVDLTVTRQRLKNSYRRMKPKAVPKGQTYVSRDDDDYSAAGAIC
jgi:hypothetical protein